MTNHPINDIMETSMEKIKEMVDVNTIIGDPFETYDGTMIIPVSRVSFGLAAGGAEYGGKMNYTEGSKAPDNAPDPIKDKFIAPVKYPFGGGSGAGVSITPIAFIVADANEVRVMSLSSNSATEKLIDLIPMVVDKIKDMFENNR